MIPKIIHLCWLSGDRYPEKIRYCIDSWKKHLPDYEIMLWDTRRFDVNSLTWTRQAFEAHKYAFAADYIRLYAVYNYGGIYFDSDIEVIASFDDLLHLPYFVGGEVDESRVELAAFGAEKGTGWVKDALDYYVDRSFIKDDGEMDKIDQPTIMSRMFRESLEWTPIKDISGFDADPSRLCVLPQDWFCARAFDAEHKLGYLVTGNTRCIHHFSNSWLDGVSGPLHRLYYKLTGKVRLYGNKRFPLYGKGRIKKKL